ncbi:hypothetical protein Q7P35_010175 [Cladosporium inversicolor]
MCKYYAHTHPCGHTKTIFAAFCPSAALVQRACAGGEIWATVKMETDCAACGVENGEAEYRSVAVGGGRRAAGHVRSTAGGEEGEEELQASRYREVNLDEPVELGMFPCLVDSMRVDMTIVEFIV